jgi:elongation factor 1-beta
LYSVTPSVDDVTVFQALGAAPEAKWVNIARWYKHIASFPEATRAAWAAPVAVAPVAEAKKEEAKKEETKKEETKEEKKDDDFDLFGDETEEEKAEKAKLAEKPKEKAKPAVIARSSVILDVKPASDETNLDELEAKIRQITKEGLDWKACERVPVAFGIKKLRIMCFIVDDLVSVDEDIIAHIEAMEDDVQSVDTHAFNKM